MFSFSTPYPHQEQGSSRVSSLLWSTTDTLPSHSSISVYLHVLHRYPLCVCCASYRGAYPNTTPFLLDGHIQSGIPNLNSITRFLPLIALRGGVPRLIRVQCKYRTAYHEYDALSQVVAHGTIPLEFWSPYPKLQPYDRYACCLMLFPPVALKMMVLSPCCAYPLPYPSSWDFD